MLIDKKIGASIVLYRQETIFYFEEEKKHNSFLPYINRIYIERFKLFHGKIKNILFVYLVITNNHTSKNRVLTFKQNKTFFFYSSQFCYVENVTELKEFLD
jgi:hypothetical protein